MPETGTAHSDDDLDVVVTVGRALVATAMMQSNNVTELDGLDVAVTVGRARVATAMMQSNNVEGVADA